MLYLGEHLTYPPESEILLIGGLGKMPVTGTAREDREGVESHGDENLHLKKFIEEITMSFVFGFYLPTSVLFYH